MISRKSCQSNQLTEDPRKRGATVRYARVFYRERMDGRRLREKSEFRAFSTHSFFVQSFFFFLSYLLLSCLIIVIKRDRKRNEHLWPPPRKSLNGFEKGWKWTGIFFASLTKMGNSLLLLFRRISVIKTGWDRRMQQVQHIQLAIKKEDEPFPGMGTVYPGQIQGRIKNSNIRNLFK